MEYDPIDVFLFGCEPKEIWKESELYFIVFYVNTNYSGKIFPENIG